MSTQVFHLIKGLGPGGAEQLLVNQAAVAQPTDVEFRVAYLVSWKKHLAERLTELGWSTVCLRSDAVWDLRWLVRLRRLLVRDDIDVVHSHSPLVAALARIVIATLPKSDRPRTMYTEHNEWARHRPWTRRLNRWTIGREDHVLAVSDAVRDSMQTDVEVEVLIHGIDVDQVAAQRSHRDAMRAELGILSKDTVIGIVANFRKEKAYDVLLNAAALLLREDPLVHFVSVGQGPLEAEVRAQHEHLKLGDRFQLLGYRPDATRVMSAFDVFTLASHHEGLPVALMEALALELPVVATSVGGIPEALAGSIARLVPPGDADALAQAYREMVDLLRSPQPTPDDVGPIRFDSSVAAERLNQLYRSLTVR